MSLIPDNRGRRGSLNLPGIHAPIAPRAVLASGANASTAPLHGPKAREAVLRSSSPNRSRSVMRDLMMTLRLSPSWVGLLAVLATACEYKVSAAEPTASGQEIFQLCVQCHGPSGAGVQPYNAPSIAGMPQWYVESQLTKFRTGARGMHWQDVGGMQMRPMALSLHNDGDLKAVAAYVATLPRPAVAPQLAGGDAERGRALFAPCAACHGQDGAGNEQLKAPPLRGGSDWYLARQIEHFKSGVRGSNPLDLEGAQMRPMAATLTDEQAIKDVVAFIASMK